MAKIFTSSDYVVEMVEKEFNNIGLANYGLNLKVMSLTKAKDVIKVSKASATTEFLANKDGMIQVFVYEEAFERLDEKAQKMLIEMALSNITYDTEKDKLNVETNPFIQVFNMRRKYGDDFLNSFEYSYAAIQQITEEEKARKEAAKEEKKKNN